MAAGDPPTHLSWAASLYTLSRRRKPFSIVNRAFEVQKLSVSGSKYAFLKDHRFRDCAFLGLGLRHKDSV